MHTSALNHIPGAQSVMEQKPKENFVPEPTRRFPNFLKDLMSIARTRHGFINGHSWEFWIIACHDPRIFDCYVCPSCQDVISDHSLVAVMRYELWFSPCTYALAKTAHPLCCCQQQTAHKFRRKVACWCTRSALKCALLATTLRCSDLIVPGDPQVNDPCVCFWVWI